MTGEEVLSCLSKYRFSLSSEKTLQAEIHKLIPEFSREYKLDEESVVDFFKDGIAVEVKIKGVAKAIYRQCERYCHVDQVKVLILVTNKSMGFPKEINGKPCYVLNLGRGWL